MLPVFIGGDPGRVVPAADAGVPVGRRAAEGGADEPAVDRRGVRRAGRGVPVGLAAGPVRPGAHRPRSRRRCRRSASPSSSGCRWTTRCSCCRGSGRSTTASGDTVESVARGIAATGRVITSAALIMTACSSASSPTRRRSSKMVGLGLATAIVPRRDRRAPGARAGAHGPAGPGQLVAARLARPAPPPRDHRSRRSSDPRRDGPVMTASLRAGVDVDRPGRPGRGVAALVGGRDPHGHRAAIGELPHVGPPHGPARRHRLAAGTGAAPAQDDRPRGRSRQRRSPARDATCRTSWSRRSAGRRRARAPRPARP